ncbi:MAG: DUF2723 domain-containing protein [Gemmatimonadales bacterium]|nr:DUF2723 domain-containing protein [Gemmatimonadales bacterium]
MKRAAQPRRKGAPQAKAAAGRSHRWRGAGISFAFWLPTWSQAVLAEVYGLGALLFGLFLVSFWRWSERRPLCPTGEARLPP